MEKTIKVIGSLYQIEEKIGVGGGGVVYLATHLRLGKKVVLKADKRTLTTSQELLKKEVNVLKDLSNSYIPQVYDYFEEDGVVYTVIDYIRGESLDKPLKRGEKFSQPQVITWAKEILNALVYLHDPSKHGNPPKGYIHSDIKPGNIMRRPDNSICLIDFNIALALGEPDILAYSPGYSSPEHYGMDYSSLGHYVSSKKNKDILDRTESITIYQDTDTKTIADKTDTVAIKADSIETITDIEPDYKKDTTSSYYRKGVYPDVRSDIYMLGATMYHLLSGKKPAKDALDVISLEDPQFSEIQISKPLIDIISKAMHPNPELRFQTALEMLREIENIREKDPRVIRYRKQRRKIIPSLFILLFAGICTMFVGMKRIKTIEEWLKITEFAENALQEGDVTGAIDLALQTFPEQKWPFKQDYIAKAQKVLTSAEGIYQLADKFDYSRIIELPSEPIAMEISPDGKTIACIASDYVHLFETGSGNSLAQLPACKSALAEVHFLDENRIVYAGEEGITLYDISKTKIIWQRQLATAIRISANKERIVSVYRDEKRATVYSTAEGTVVANIEFGDKHQDVIPNDIFLNPQNNLLAINEDGSKIAISFSDGSLIVYDLCDEENAIEIFGDSSGYTHFEGGFSKQYFAFSASDKNKSMFAVVDIDKGVQVGSFPENQTAYGVDVNEERILVQQDNVLIELNPETGEQIPLITTKELFQHYCSTDSYSVVTVGEEMKVFDHNAHLLDNILLTEKPDYLCINDSCIVLGNMSSSKLNILEHESFPEKTVCKYDNLFAHSEARISSDKKYLMLFDYTKFRIINILTGNIMADISLNEITGKDSREIYDQQYIHDTGADQLEVTYNDGTVFVFNAVTGMVLQEKTTDRVRNDLSETYFTSKYRIESPVHGSPCVYDKEAEKKLAALGKDDYLSYVYEVNGMLVLQFITADGYIYGEILDDNLEVITELPYLCDVVDQEFFFDCPTGVIRCEHMYTQEEILKKVKE